MFEDINRNIEFVKFIVRFFLIAEDSDVKPLKGFTLPTVVHVVVLAGSLGLG
jgi:hypothetical protein